MANNATAEPKKTSILIVDDDEKLCELHAAMFREAGFDVATAIDGEEGWKNVSESVIPPDVVLTGIRMPKMTGFDLFKKMRSDPKFKAIPVAMYSHQGMEEHQKMAESWGVNRFIVRAQTTPGEVVQIIKEMLGSRRPFKVAFDRGRFNGVDLVNFMDHAEKTHFADAPTRSLIFLIEPLSTEGTYRVRLEEEGI